MENPAQIIKEQEIGIAWGNYCSRLKQSDGTNGRKT